MTTRGRKKAAMSPDTFDLVANRFRLLGVPLRLQILYELSDGQRSVGELVDATGSTQPNVSKHLSSLLAHGLVKRVPEGNSVYYSVTDRNIYELCELVCGSIESGLDRQKKMLNR